MFKVIKKDTPSLLRYFYKILPYGSLSLRLNIVSSVPRLKDNLFLLFKNDLEIYVKLLAFICFFLNTFYWLLSLCPSIFSAQPRFSAFTQFTSVNNFAPLSADRLTQTG